MIAYFGPEKFVTAPAPGTTLPTFGDIWDNSNTGRIILINSCEPVAASPCIWDNSTPNQSMVDSEWQDVNQDDPTTLFNDLTVVFEKWKNSPQKYANKLKVMQAMTSAGKKIKSAQNTNIYLCSQISTRKIWPVYPLNIIQVDNSTNSNLMPLVIAMNNYITTN